jgi:hypothetical protein
MSAAPKPRIAALPWQSILFAMDFSPGSLLALPL